MGPMSDGASGARLQKRSCTRFSELPVQIVRLPVRRAPRARCYARVAPPVSSGVPSGLGVNPADCETKVTLSLASVRAAARVALAEPKPLSFIVPKVPMAPPSPAWSQPRAWSRTVSTPTRGRTALADHSGMSVSVSAGASPCTPTRPTTSRRNTGAIKPLPTLEDLFVTAHVVREAPLTVPVGIINQGNSCFANVILQMLVYCRPMYSFLTQLHSMVPRDLSNSTPLLEALFQFLGEIPLQVFYNGTEPDPILPDYVYDAMRLHKRFDLLQLGQQEDAEEFLSLVLNTLHDETLLVYRRAQQRQLTGSRRTTCWAAADPFAADPAPEDLSSDEERIEIQRPQSPDSDEWLEVGQKGKTSLTRTSGSADSQSPITRLFDGKLRSTLSCPGSKTSIMLEPYRSLPLDIQPFDVRTIEDALRHITEPETISGVWSPGRNAFVDATKQVCIEALPPLLVLHLKRFVYDEVYGVQKSSKPVSFGLELTVRPEVLSPPLRRMGDIHRYELYSVVYHHGRLASGGHYTAAVRRQDGSGWLHFDDTNVWPIPVEEVTQNNRMLQDAGDAYLLFYQRV